MNMKKIAILALSLCMIAAIAVTGTIAYFTDTDAAENTFTVGDVDISIYEEYETPENIVPNQKVDKNVYVVNDGTNKAYVRVHVAFPNEMDDGNPEFAAYANFLHWNFTKESYADGQWSWNKTLDGANYPGNGSSEWNYYEADIDGEHYNVYVATYETALTSGAMTATDAITGYYLDASIEDTINDDGTITYTSYDKDGNVVREVTLGADEVISIPVFAQAVQADTFTDAFAAFNAANMPNPWPDWVGAN